MSWIGDLVPAAKSFRLPEELVERLAEHADREGASQTVLVISLLDEGLKTRTFPGVVYRDGPTGRRAALAVGPDVWEVIATVQSARGSGDEKVGHAAEMLDLHERWVRLAVSFYAAHPDEIERRIAANAAAMDKAREQAERHEQLLA